MNLVVHFVWRRKGQTYNYIPIHGQWAMAWLDGQGFGKSITGKISDEEIWGRGT